MARIDITLNGRRFPVACEDGEEERVRQIAAYVDGKLMELKGDIASASDMHLLVMASLMIADELVDARQELEVAQSGCDQKVAAAREQAEEALRAAEVAKRRADEKLAQLRDQDPADPAEDAQVAQVIIRLATRLETLAGRLRQA